MPTEPLVKPLADPVVIDLHGRVSALEKSEANRNTEIALMKKDLEYIRDGQDKVTSGINKILWAIALSVIAAGTAWVLNGGLSLTN